MPASITSAKSKPNLEESSNVLANSVRQETLLNEETEDARSQVDQTALELKKRGIVPVDSNVVLTDFKKMRSKTQAASLGEGTHRVLDVSRLIPPGLAQDLAGEGNPIRYPGGIEKFKGQEIFRIEAKPAYSGGLVRGNMEAFFDIDHLSGISYSMKLGAVVEGNPDLKREIERERGLDVKETAGTLIHHIYDMRDVYPGLFGNMSFSFVVSPDQSMVLVEEGNDQKTLVVDVGLVRPGIDKIIFLSGLSEMGHREYRKDIVDQDALVKLFSLFMGVRSAGLIRGEGKIQLDKRLMETKNFQLLVLLSNLWTSSPENDWEPFWKLDFSNPKHKDYLLKAAAEVWPEEKTVYESYEKMSLEEFSGLIQVIDAYATAKKIVDLMQKFAEKRRIWQAEMNELLRLDKRDITPDGWSPHTFALGALSWKRPVLDDRFVDKLGREFVVLFKKGRLDLVLGLIKDDLIEEFVESFYVGSFAGYYSKNPSLTPRELAGFLAVVAKERPILKKKISWKVESKAEDATGYRKAKVELEEVARLYKEISDGASLGKSGEETQNYRRTLLIQPDSLSGYVNEARKFLEATKNTRVIFFVRDWFEKEKFKKDPVYAALSHRFSGRVQIEKNKLFSKADLEDLKKYVEKRSRKSLADFALIAPLETLEKTSSLQGMIKLASDKVRDRNGVETRNISELGLGIKDREKVVSALFDSAWSALAAGTGNMEFLSRARQLNRDQIFVLSTEYLHKWLAHLLTERSYQQQCLSAA